MSLRRLDTTTETTSSREAVLYEGQARALKQMMAGMDDAVRWIVLVGPEGSGKSIILKALIDELRKTDADVVVCDGFDSVEPEDLMTVLRSEILLPISPSPNGRHADAIVASRQTHTNPLVLIVDNARAVSRQTLELLAEVASQTSAEHGGAWVVLAGRPAFDATALRVGLKLRHVRCTPAPLTAPEIARHVDRCLQSGPHRSVRISPDAVENIGHCTEGIPGRIEALCDLVVQRPSVRLTNEVTAEAVEEAADRLGFGPSSAPLERGRRLTSGDKPWRRARRWLRRVAMLTLIIAVGALGWVYGLPWARAGSDWVTATLFPPEPVSPAKPSEKAARPGTPRREAGGTATANARSTAGRPAGDQRSGSSRPDSQTRPDGARSGPRPVSAEQVSALIAAARGGHSDDLARALSAGVPAEVRDAGGVTALMHAVAHGHVDAGRMLLDKGAHVNARDRGGITPTMLAVINDRPDALRLLLERGADVNARSGSGWTALTFAAWKGDPDMVRALMRRGAKRNVVDKQGWTPLDYAAANVESVPTDPEPSGASDGPPKQGSRHSEVVSLLRGTPAP